MPPSAVTGTPVRLQVNDDIREIVVDPATTLLTALRDELHLTGTKSVCEMGNCGACTVLLDGDAVYSCLVLAVECGGRPVTTIEGLAAGNRPGRVQTAFVDCDALQCGFCTPGQVMTVEAHRRKGGADDEATLRSALSGNLCRCGAYEHIIEAARRACAPERRP